MPDQRIIDYLRQHGKTHPTEALKKALIQNGFPAADVDEAVRIVSGQAPPAPASSPSPIEPGATAAAAANPAQPAAAEAASGDFIELSPKNLISNAVMMVKEPATFFSRLNPNGSFGSALVNILIWMTISMGVTAGLMFAKIGPASAAVGGAFTLIALPFVLIAGVIGSLIGGAVYHVLCLILGSSVGFTGTFQIIGAVAAMGPAGSLLNAVPYGSTLMVVAWGFFTYMGAVHLHKIGTGKAKLVFGGLAGLFVLIAVGAQIATRKFSQMAQSGDFAAMINAQLGKQMAGMPTAAGTTPGRSFPGGTPQAPGSVGAAPQNASQAMQMANQMLARMGTPEQQKQLQTAMAQASAQSATIMQDLAKYSKMKRPPRKTLRLLDSKGQRMLKDAWPTLASPVRKSLVEALPRYKTKRQRTSAMEQMLAQTQQMNQALNQSMQMLQGLMQQQQGQ